MGNSRNGVVAKWVGIGLTALGIMVAAVWSIAGVHNKAETNAAAVETLEKEQSDMAKDVAEIKGDVKVLLDRTKD